MASCAPTLMRTVSGGRSWVNVVAGHPPTVKRKRVGWEPEEGVETRVYVTDIGDDVEYVPRGSGGGWGACPHSYWNHVPWVVGEISEDSINIDGVPVAQRTSFSSINVKDGDDLPSNVFGRCVSAFFEGVDEKSSGLERGEKKKVNKLSPLFWSTGVGKEYVGHEGLSKVFVEALNTINDGRKFGMVKQACNLNETHESTISNLYRLYKDACQARVVQLEEKLLKLETCSSRKKKLSTGAPEFRPGLMWCGELVDHEGDNIYISDLLENKARKVCGD